MVEALREPTGEYEIGSSALIDDETVVELNDVEAATAFLRRFADDVAQMARLRRLLDDDESNLVLGDMGDDEVIDAIAVRLVDGRLSIGELTEMPLYALPTIAPAAAAPAPPARKATRSQAPTTAMLTVAVVRADGGKLSKPATVTLAGPSGGSKPTDGSDVGIFSGLAPGDYKITAKLSEAEKNFELEDSSFAGSGYPITLAAGDTRSCSARVHPPARLEVIVVGADGEPLLGDVKVDVSGPSARGGGTAKDTGATQLEDLSSGTYTLTLTLPADHGAKYGVPATAPKITLARGQKGQLRVVLPERPEPTLKIDDPKIVLVRHKYVDDASLHVTPHRIPVTLGVRGEFDGTGELSCGAADAIKVYGSKDTAAEIALPAPLTAEQLKKGHVLYVEGRKASPSVGGTELKLEIKGSKLPPKKNTATEKITCVNLQLDAYKSRPEGGGEPTALTEDEKIKPGRHVVVQGSSNDRLFAERALIVVKKAEPQDFAGKLVLKSRTGGVTLFPSAQEVPAAGQAALADAALHIDNATIDAAKGQRFWAQGQTKSGALGDTGLIVELESIPGAEGDRITMTVLKLDLRLHQSRTQEASAGAPAALSDDDKMKVGRFVHLQDTGNHHGRALLDIAKVEPNDFVGTLVFTAWDAKHTPSYSATKTNASKVELYADEIAAGGQAAIALGEIDHPATFPADGRRFWVQGKTLSGELRDTELRLGVKDVDKGCERATFTVVRFKNLKADIPSTPANTVRAVNTGGGSNSPVNRHTLEIGKPPAAKDFDPDYATNAPLVLVESSVRSTDKINLSVEVEPANVPVRWDCVRDRRPGQGDHADIIALAGNSDDPGLTQDAGDPLKATLTADAVGSFHVCPYVDGNANNKFDFAANDGTRIDREPYIMMNMVLIRVQGVSNLSSANSAAGLGLVTANQNVQPPNPAWGVVPVPQRFNTGDFANTGNDAVRMIAITRVIGGGQDGKRGLDALFCGWTNNEIDCPTSPSGGVSEDVTHFHQNSAPGSPVRRLRCFWQLNGAVAAGPVLDSGYANQGTGGQTCTGTEGHNGPNRLTKTNHASGIGQTWREENVDSPGGGIRAFHPLDPAAWLNRFTFNIDFRCALMFWTNMAKVANNTDRPAVRLYSTVQTNTWNIRFEVTFAVNFAQTIVTAKTVTFNADADPGRRATPVDGSGLETRLPDGLTILQTNQNF